MKAGIYIAEGHPDVSDMMQLWLEPETDDERRVVDRLMHLDSRDGDGVMVWYGDIEIGDEATTSLKIDLSKLPDRVPEPVGRA